MDTTSPAIEGAGEHIGESSVPAVQRYNLYSEEPSMSNPYGEPAVQVGHDTRGEWVKYDDYLRAILNPLGNRLTKDDAATFAAFQFILDNIADLEQDEHFAGFQLQRATTEDGKLLYLRLVPCDNLGGVTAPRVA